MAKHIIIIGGGISGLAAGIFAQKMGFASEIYEKHSIPGGECTGWDRQGYHIDGCIHWLTGTKAETSLGKLWREVGALGEGVDIYQPDTLCTAEYDGVVVSLYSDLAKMQAHLTDISPEDAVEIAALCNDIKKMWDAGIPELPPDMMNPLDLLHLMTSMSTGMKIMKRYNMTLSDYVKRFHSPAVQRALCAILPTDNCAYILPYSLSTICSGNGGRPVGGSKAMALRMAEKYAALGGQLHLGKSVERIEIKDGKASGIRFADGSAATADYILPATDIHLTLDRLLGGKYPNPQIAERDANPSVYPAPTCVYAAFGIDADLSDISPDLVFQTTPYTFEDKEMDTVSFKHYCYEPSFAPVGKSVGVVYIAADYTWWKRKHGDPQAYRAEKARLAAELCAALEKRFPQLKGKITPLDVATPITYERYCGAWQGAWMAYGTTPASKQMMQNGRIKGIDNLYMAGQWLMPPGGLPVAVTTGKWAIQRICRQEKLPWRW